MHAIIPEPVEFHIINESISHNLPHSLIISPHFKNIANILTSQFSLDWELNLSIRIEENPKENDNCILITQSNDSKLPNPEGYQLKINNSTYQIEALEEVGIFYGFQTLRQFLFNHLLPISKKPSFIGPDCEIVDYPRFPWRGFMLDEARYFLGKGAVKKVLDWMALLKLNRFHWHLTEDQGWRIEIKHFPKLTSIGSKRIGTPKLRNRNRGHDGIPHEGFYTQTDIKEIVAYAQERFIEIIPEIEMPGHVQALLAVYPELSCTGGPFEVSSIWGVHRDVACLGNEKVVPFFKQIIDEVVPLFPSKYLHLGGDEVPKDRWKTCPKCQAKIKEEGLTDEHHLQVEFTNTMVEYLASKGKEVICWNEVTDDRLDPRTISQFWRGDFKNIFSFLELGGKTIVSPSSKYYVDITYEHVSLNTCYNYEPVPPDIANRFSKNILGVEAEMWGEVFKNVEKMEYCSFPRVLAIAESAWAPSTQKNLDHFLQKIPAFLRILDKFYITYTPLHVANPTLWERIKNHLKPGFGHYL
jgi:hexosaminidase